MDRDCKTNYRNQSDEPWFSQPATPLDGYLGLLILLIQIACFLKAIELF
jgi:hypothetical protein